MRESGDPFDVTSGDETPIQRRSMAMIDWVCRGGGAEIVEEP